MNPAAALANPAFRTYGVVVAAILLLAGLALAVLRFGLRKEVGPVAATWRAWLVMCPLFFGSLLAGRAAVILFFALLAFGGFKEFARATGLYRDWGMTGAVYLAIAGTVTACLVTDPFQGRPGWLALFMSLPVYAVALFMMVPIVRNRTQGQVQTLALAILGFVYLGWMFLHVAYLANAEHACEYLLYLVFAVEVNDVAAFTCGRLFGRSPLRSSISPRKTWGGSLGALAVSLALPWVLWPFLPHFEPLHLVLAGVTVGIGGQMGDLSISVVKRDIGVKDMGALIPGHGGILDRVDSLIYVAPLFLHGANYFFGL